LLVLTEPGKITRIDYRKFTWSAYVNFQTTRKQLAGMENVWDRIKKYLEHRDRKSYNVTLEEETRTIVLEFEKLDDARMFMLAFSDAIIDNGIKYE
jgi:hypothetical protein